MGTLEQEEQEKEVKEIRRKMILRYGLAFAGWTAAALLGIGLLVAVVLFVLGVLHL